MTLQAAHRLDELLEELPWLRRLAVALVGHDGAEDVVQDAIASAIHETRRGRRPTNLRAWLATVLRNRARRVGRREQQRAQVERQRIDQVEEPDVADVIERAELHRELTEAVTCLPKDQRVIVMLRHYEELDFAAIAARTGLTVEAARSRHRRALATLRERLDRRPGGRAAWVALLLPRPPAPIAPPATPLPPWVWMSGLGAASFAAILGLAAVAAALRGDPTPTDVASAPVAIGDLGGAPDVPPADTAPDVAAAGGAAGAPEGTPAQPQDTTPRPPRGQTSAASGSSSFVSVSTFVSASIGWPQEARGRAVELRLLDERERPLPTAELQVMPVTSALTAPRWTTETGQPPTALLTAATDRDGHVQLPWSEATQGALWIRVRRGDGWTDLGKVEFTEPGAAVVRRLP